jgi:hypothetical protein
MSIIDVPAERYQAGTPGQAMARRANAFASSAWHPTPNLERNN